MPDQQTQLEQLLRAQAPLDPRMVMLQNHLREQMARQQFAQDSQPTLAQRLAGSIGPQPTAPNPQPSPQDQLVQMLVRMLQLPGGQPPAQPPQAPGGQMPPQQPGLQAPSGPALRMRPIR